MGFCESLSFKDAQEVLPSIICIQKSVYNTCKNGDLATLKTVN